MLLLSLALTLPFLTAPQQDKVQITCGAGASKPVFSQTGEKGLYECNDGAVVIRDDMRFEADWIKFDPATNQLTAGDRVHFVRGGEDVRGSSLSFNLDSKTGTLSDASGQIEGWYLKTDNYVRRADGKWELAKPVATACAGDCPLWHFTWRDATVTPGKNVSGHGMALRFRNIPVLYLPRFSMPTESKERSSGFLIPSIARSTTKGFSIRQAFFWAMGRSYDTTFIGEYYTKRGPTGTIDFRGVPNPNSSIDVSTLFAVDREQQGGYRTRIRMFSDLGGNWRGVANADITSSFEFRQVYEDGFNVISSPIQQSTAFLTRNRPGSSLNFLYNRTAVFYPNEPSTTLRKFPAVDVQLPTKDIGGAIPVYFSMEGSLTGMARRDSIINTPALMRVDIHPTIEIPVLRSSLLNWSHEFGVRETLYTQSLNPGTPSLNPAVTGETLNRAIFDYKSRITGPQLVKNYGTWRHLIEPTLEYRYVTGVDEFRKTIVVDETDLIANTHEIEYGITNRFFAGYEFLTWRIAQKMYFDPTFGGALVPGKRNTLEPLMDLTGFAFSDGEARRFSPIVSTVRIATTPNTTTDIEVDYDTEREEFRAAGISGAVNRGRFNTSIGYFFNKRSEIQPPSNQLRGLVSFGSQNAPGLSAGVGFAYDIYHSLFQGATAQVSYNAECYGLGFEFTKYALGARREFGWRANLSLKNLGSFGTLRPQERLF